MCFPQSVRMPAVFITLAHVAIFFDVGGKSLWRAADFVRADTGDALLHVGDFKRARDFPMRAADDSGRRAGGSNEALVSCLNAILVNFLIFSKNL